MLDEEFRLGKRQNKLPNSRYFQLNSLHENLMEYGGGGELTRGTGLWRCANNTQFSVFMKEWVRWRVIIWSGGRDADTAEKTIF